MVLHQMWDYDSFKEMSKGIYNIIKYGTSEADINGRILASDPFETVNKRPRSSRRYQYPIGRRLQFAKCFGRNCTVGREMKIGMPKIKHAIENYIPSNSRSQLIQRQQ